MWQIGVLTGKPCTFLVQNGSFSAFWHYKNKERLSRGLDVKWHIPSSCLDVSRKCFSTGIYSKTGFPSGYGQKIKKPLKMAKMCTVSRLERQSATLCLLHAPTNIPPNTTTHPNTSTICTNNFGTFCTNCLHKLFFCLGGFRSRLGKPNQRKRQNEKFMNFAQFCEFWCFSLGKQARFTLNFCSRMPL